MFVYTSNYVYDNHTELQLRSLFSGRKYSGVWLCYNYKDVLSLFIMDVQDSSHAFTLTMGLLKAACLERSTSLAPSPLPRAEQLPASGFEGLLPKGPL